MIKTDQTKHQLSSSCASLLDGLGEQANSGSSRSSLAKTKARHSKVRSLLFLDKGGVKQPDLLHGKHICTSESLHAIIPASKKTSSKKNIFFAKGRKFPQDHCIFNIENCDLKQEMMILQETIEDTICQMPIRIQEAIQYCEAEYSKASPSQDCEQRLNPLDITLDTRMICSKNTPIQQLETNKKILINKSKAYYKASQSQLALEVNLQIEVDAYQMLYTQYSDFFDLNKRILTFKVIGSQHKSLDCLSANASISLTIDELRSLIDYLQCIHLISQKLKGILKQPHYQRKSLWRDCYVWLSIYQNPRRILKFLSEAGMKCYLPKIYIHTVMPIQSNPLILAEEMDSLTQKIVSAYEYSWVKTFSEKFQIQSYGGALNSEQIKWGFLDFYQFLIAEQDQLPVLYAQSVSNLLTPPKDIKDAFAQDWHFFSALAKANEEIQKMMLDKSCYFQILIQIYMIKKLFQKNQDSLNRLDIYTPFLSQSAMSAPLETLEHITELKSNIQKVCIAMFHNSVYWGFLKIENNRFINQENSLINEFYNSIQKNKEILRHQQNPHFAQILEEIENICEAFKWAFEYMNTFSFIEKGLPIPAYKIYKRLTYYLDVLNNEELFPKNHISLLYYTWNSYQLGVATILLRLFVQQIVNATQQNTHFKNMTKLIVTLLDQTFAEKGALVDIKTIQQSFYQEEKIFFKLKEKKKIGIKHAIGLFQWKRLEKDSTIPSLEYFTQKKV